MSSPKPAHGSRSMSGRQAPRTRWLVAIGLALSLVASVVFAPPSDAQAPPGPEVPNPGFEEIDDGTKVDQIVGWRFQDKPGELTFVDTSVSRSGDASLRADLVGGQHSRAMVEVAVTPNTEYTVAVWVKADSATSNNWGVLVRDADDNTKRAPATIFLPGANGDEFPVSGPQDLTRDWTRIEKTFNSEASKVVSIMLAGWGGQSGSLYWDDLSVTAADQPPIVGDADDHEWLHMSANLVVDEVDDLLATIDEAKQAGANGVLFSDTKANNFSRVNYAGWEDDMKRLRQEVQDRGMDFVINMTPVGFCSPLLYENTDLAAGYPIAEQPLRVQGNQLVPVETAPIANGGFEEPGNEIVGGAFQDAVGQRTFRDTSVARTGEASFRADASGGEMSRLFIDVEVEPWQQYTATVWIKTQNLTARNTSLLIFDGQAPAENRRQFASQDLSLPGENGRRSYFSGSNNLTTDWTEIRIAFNSLDAQQVRLGLAVFGGESGSIWWDDLQLESTPTLNWINRPGLDQSLVTEDGRPLSIGGDTSAIDDPLLGEVLSYSGTYDSYHRAPVVTVNPSSGLVDGDIVLLSGWHTVVTARGQIGCSWNDPGVLALLEDSVAAVYELIEPDGVLLNYSEIRTGGFEPSDTVHGSSGAAMAASISTMIDRTDAIIGDADLYMWSDMIQPFQNARPNYYQVAGDLSGAIEGVDPKRVTVINWSSGDRLRGGDAAGAVDFFEARGFQQMIGGFYDEDVASNRDAWVAATEGADGIVGSLYATWVRPRDFTQIAEFGDAWWTSD